MNQMLRQKQGNDLESAAVADSYKPVESFHEAWIQLLDGLPVCLAGWATCARSDRSITVHELRLPQH